MKRRPRAYRTRGVFLNIPFDDQYENCFIALIAGVAGLGLKPTSVLDVSTSDQRLQRIFEHLSNCRYSIHDLSRLERLYKAVRIRARELKREARTLYEAHPFHRLAAFAMALADEEYGRQRSN